MSLSENRLPKKYCPSCSFLFPHYIYIYIDIDIDIDIYILQLTSMGEKHKPLLDKPPGLVVIGQGFRGTISCSVLRNHSNWRATLDAVGAAVTVRARRAGPTLGTETCRVAFCTLGLALPELLVYFHTLGSVSLLNKLGFALSLLKSSLSLPRTSAAPSAAAA